MSLVTLPINSAAEVLELFGVEGGVQVYIRGSWYTGTVSNFPGGNWVEVTIDNPPTLDQMGRGGLARKIFSGDKVSSNKIRVDMKTQRTTKPSLRKVVI